MFLAFMNLNEHPDERYILEMEMGITVIDNELFDSVWRTDSCIAVWHAHPWPGPRGMVSGHTSVTSIIGVSGRLWPVTLSLSLSAATLRQCRHSPLTLQRSVLVGLCPSDRCQWSNQCFVTPHNNKSIHPLMCCFVFCVTHWWLC